MDMHPQENVARFDAESQFSDRAAAVELAGDHLQIVLTDRALVEQRESLTPGAEHVFGVAEALFRRALQRAAEKSD